jgi:hypothetical protein
MKLEGYESALPYAPNYLMLAVTKLTVGGKDYDLTPFRGPMAGGRGFGQGGMMGGRRPGYGGGGGWGYRF